MRMRLRILTVALIVMVGMTSVLTAGGKKEAAASDTVELRLAWWGAQARHEIYYQLIEAFEARYPNISLRPEPASWDDYWDRLTTQAAGGNAPDIVHKHLTRLHEYASRGVLLNLDPYVADNRLDLRDWTEGIVNSGRYDGKIYTISIGNSITSTMINADAFSRLGVEVPPIEANWTWEQFLAVLRAARAAESRQDRWIMNDASGADTSLDFFLRQRGKSLFTEQGQLGFEPQDLTEWWRLWETLRSENIVPPAEVTAEHTNVDDADQLITKRWTMATFIPGNQVVRFQRHMEDTIRLRRYPTYPAAAGDGEFVEGAYISVAANTPHPEQAVQFLDWFMNTEEAIGIFRTEHGAFGNTRMNEFIIPQLEPMHAHVIEATQYASQYASPRIDYPAGSGEVLGFYRDGAEDIRFGQKTVEQAVTEFFRDARNVLR